jgi:hypothetical protein
MKKFAKANRDATEVFIERREISGLRMSADIRDVKKITIIDAGKRRCIRRR